jgi:hypothetical protein
VKISDPFLAYLYEQEQLSADQITAIEDIQHHEKPSIGTIAKKMGFLNAMDVMEIIQIQINNENKVLFGEIAVKMEKLTARQVEQILTEQQKLIPASKDILLRKQFLSEEECHALYKSFSSQE